jgi:hypothetical protein
MLQAFRDRGESCNHKASSNALEPYTGSKEKTGGAVMMEEYRGWIHRHIHVVLSFMIGMTLGISILALAYFSTGNDVAAGAIRYGVQFTGHPDVGEDMAWFFCGSMVGATIICLAWWRDSKAQSAELEQADVLNRLISDPVRPVARSTEKIRQDADA